MRKQVSSISNSLLACCLFMLLTQCCVTTEAKTCKPNGKIRGKKTPPECNLEDDTICCIEGKLYDTYKCSPPVTGHTNATLNLDTFEKGGDGNPPSKCDKKYHSDNEIVVALSTGWFNKKRRCLKHINIYGNGKSVRAKVVDECDSTKGCDAKHDYQPPCDNNIVVASRAVWEALSVPRNQWGELDIYWSDA